MSTYALTSDKSGLKCRLNKDHPSDEVDLIYVHVTPGRASDHAKNKVRNLGNTLLLIDQESLPRWAPLLAPVPGLHARSSSAAASASFSQTLQVGDSSASSSSEAASGIPKLVPFQPCLPGSGIGKPSGYHTCTWVPAQSAPRSYRTLPPLCLRVLASRRAPLALALALPSCLRLIL